MKSIFKNRNLKPCLQTHVAGLIAGTGLLLAISSGLSWATESVSHGHHADAIVYKTAQCGCCDKWAEQLEASGLNVEIAIVRETNTIRRELGIPQQLGSCHTAMAGDYWIEGHVPIDLVHQLLEEQPENIKGIMVPGMPAGSPGMESPAPVEYKVLSLDDQGKVEVFAVRKGKTAQ